MKTYLILAVWLFAYGFCASSNRPSWHRRLLAFIFVPIMFWEFVGHLVGTKFQRWTLS